MTYESLIFGIENGVARITINRPVQLNAMDVLMAKEFALAPSNLAPSRAVRCVVLTGAGDRAFCAGGDVAGFASDPERVDSLIEEGSDLRVRAHAGDAHRRSKRHGSWRRPRPRGGRRSRCRFPVGKIHQRLHEDRAHPDGSTTWFMPRLIGHRRTTELFLLNRVLSADEAMAWGLVNPARPRPDTCVRGRQTASAFGAMTRTLSSR